LALQQNIECVPENCDVFKAKPLVLLNYIKRIIMKKTDKNNQFKILFWY